MIDLTKPIMTRDGRAVRLLTAQSDYRMGGVRYPIVAEVAHPTKPNLWSRQHFTVEGYYHHGKPNDEGNLVNWAWTPPKATNWELSRALRDIQRATNVAGGLLLNYDAVYIYAGLSPSISANIDKAIAVYQHYSINYSCAMYASIDAVMHTVRGENTYDMRPFLHRPNIMGMSVPITQYSGEIRYINCDLSKPDDILCKIILSGYFPIVWRALMDRIEGDFGWETTWSVLNRKWLDAALRGMDEKKRGKPMI